MTMSQPSTPVLEVTPTSVISRGTVTVTWRSLPSPTATAWVGLYASADAADTAYLDYRYLTSGSGAAESGSLTFPMPEAASTTYELRIFANGGYERKAKSSSVTVSRPVKLTVEPRSVAPGATVTVTWSDVQQPSS